MQRHEEPSHQSKRTIYYFLIGIRKGIIMVIVKCDRLKKRFFGRAGIVKAVDDVSLEIERAEAFGLVGESGCGKTTLGKIILGVLKPDSGNVILGTKKMQVIFQSSYNSLDPKMNISDILSEGLIIKGTGQGEIKRKVEAALDLVKLPKEALKKYPHQFSGGERQRIAVGRAVLTDPEFIVCDEPVSSLDVTIQLQILNLLKEIQKRFGITYLFISHDLRVIKFMCNRLAVMRHGKVLETGPVDYIYSNPSHPYTRSLLSSHFYDIIKNDASLKL